MKRKYPGFRKWHTLDLNSSETFVLEMLLDNLEPRKASAVLQELSKKMNKN